MDLDLELLQDLPAEEVQAIFCKFSCGGSCPATCPLTCVATSD